MTSLVQPLLFLFVLGSGLQQLSSASTHGVDRKTFIYPGVLCIAVVFTAMFSAASIVWDREFGFLREMLVAPVRRSSIVIGKCLGTLDPGVTCASSLTVRWQVAASCSTHMNTVRLSWRSGTSSAGVRGVGRYLLQEPPIVLGY